MAETLHDVKNTVKENAGIISSLTSRFNQLELHVDSSIDDMHSKLETADRDRSDMRGLICNHTGILTRD